MKITAIILVDLGKELPTMCMKSLANEVDEVVVVNTGKNLYVHGAINVKYDSEDFNFAEARNVGIKASGGDYIFSIDSDERLVNNINLKQIINDNIVDYYHITVKQWHTMMHTKSQFQTYSLSRIFYKTKELEYRNKIHESVSKSLKKGAIDYAIPDFQCYIAHLGYDLTREKMQQKLERNIKFAYDMIDKGEEDVYTYYHLGKLMGVIGDFHEQAYFYKKALEMGGLNQYHQEGIKRILIKLKELL